MHSLIRKIRRGDKLKVHAALTYPLPHPLTKQASIPWLPSSPDKGGIHTHTLSLTRQASTTSYVNRRSIRILLECNLRKNENESIEICFTLLSLKRTYHNS